MAITGPASYIPTADKFIAHWMTADAALAATGPLKVLRDVALADLITLRGKLESQRAEVEVLRNGREFSRAAIEQGKSQLLGRLNQFKLKIRSLVPGTHWERALPKIFSLTEGFGKVIPPLEEMADLWRRYEKEDRNLTLMGLCTRTDYDAALAALQTAYTALISAEQALSMARSQRTELETRIHAVLKAYRQRIPAEFPEGHPILETLPRLTPAQTSRPPAPVQAGGAWNLATVQADLNWTASSDRDLAHYEVRAVAGPEYDEEDESTVVTRAPEDPRVWSGNYALTSPGTAASFRVYVLLRSGHERGSNPVTITRPSPGLAESIEV